MCLFSRKKTAIATLLVLVLQLSIPYYTKGFYLSKYYKQNTKLNNLKSNVQLRTEYPQLADTEGIIKPDRKYSYEDAMISGEEEAEHVDVLTPILISIEGNIGAGKTTLLEELRLRHPEWKIISEPVDTWSQITNDNGDSILQVFYQDRKRWSYTFQNCALLTRYQNIEDTIVQAREVGLTGKLVFLTERCLDTDYHVFTKMLRSEGSIDKLELELYERLLNQLKVTATPLSAIIHVETNPLTCGERIKQRSRTGEESIPMEYLESLNHYQCKWVNSIEVPTIKYSDRPDITHLEEFIRGLLK